MKKEDEQHRLECEAREWLRRGFGNRINNKELMKNIRKKRGQQAADELREEMRRQWRLQLNENKRLSRLRK